LADWKKAFVAAVGLLGEAAFILFVIRPGGFETQVGWFIALLPGALLALPLADRVYALSPILDKVFFWPFTLAASLIWYSIVSFAVIKTFRLLSRAGGN